MLVPMAKKDDILGPLLQQVKRLKGRRAELQAEIDRIDGALRTLGQEVGNGSPTPRVPPRHPGQRTQRIGKGVSITLGTTKGMPKANKAAAKRADARPQLEGIQAKVIEWMERDGGPEYTFDEVVKGTKLTKEQVKGALKKLRLPTKTGRPALVKNFDGVWSLI